MTGAVLSPADWRAARAALAAPRPAPVALAGSRTLPSLAKLVANRVVLRLSRRPGFAKELIQ